VQNNPMSLTDPNGLDCLWQNDDGSVSTSVGDCPTTGPGANGVYIDCDGCVKGGTFDSNGDLSSYTDGTNNYDINGNLLPGVASMAGTNASNNDVAIDYDIWHCPTCANTWKQANCVVSKPAEKIVASMAPDTTTQTPEDSCPAIR
jgi:hypothetical protein